MELTLPNGEIALVDAEDHPKVLSLRWCVITVNRKKYILSTKYGIYLHRLILDAKKGEEVDHINGDTFDNRRSNLRLCTHQQNLWNRPPFRNSASGYKGVFKDHNSWNVRIMLNGKQVNLGNFKDPIEAAKVYDEAALKHFGDYAYINFPPILSGSAFFQPNRRSTDENN